jgi:cytochrome c5
MRKLAIIPALLILAACDRAPTARFADAAITLPDDPGELPEVPGKQAVIENCTACHSPSTMLQQPKVDRAKWQAIIVKMRKLYKAPVDDDAVPAIVDYLLAMQSTAAPQTPRP